MRVATIDIGTNTALLLIAEATPSSGLTAVLERATITRLGQGVDRTRSLAPEAIERTLACLRTYAADVRDAGVSNVAIVGTSAMRDAKGGEALRESIRGLFGVTPQVISGEREALLTFAGALSGLPVEKGADTVVFDIGGGSTEVVRGRVGGGGNAVEFTTSIDVGSVRLTERHIRNDPPRVEELAELDAALTQAFEVVPATIRAPCPVGIAGTMTTLAAISMGLTEYDSDRVHGCSLSQGEVKRVASMLANVPLAERQRIPGLEPKRADVIVAGAHIAMAFMSRVGATEVRISDRGVRWGLALEIAASALNPK